MKIHYKTINKSILKIGTEEIYILIESLEDLEQLTEELGKLGIFWSNPSIYKKQFIDHYKVMCVDNDNIGWAGALYQYKSSTILKGYILKKV